MGNNTFGFFRHTILWVLMMTQLADGWCANCISKAKANHLTVDYRTTPQGVDTPIPQMG